MPIGPDFHDPPSATPIPELPPYFGVASPQLETTVVYGGMVSDAMMPPFEVTVSDPNPQDSVYVRWIANYPPFRVGGTMIIGPPEIMGAVGNVGVTFLKRISCSQFPSAADRSLAMVVSDRPFVDAPSATDDNRLSFYADDHKVVKQTFVVGSWRITGCPQ